MPPDIFPPARPSAKPPQADETFRPLTEIELMAVKDKAASNAKDTLKGRLDTATTEERENAYIAQYQKITGAPQDTSYVSSKNATQVEIITREFIDRAKAELGIPSHDDGLFRLRPAPTPPAPMPMQPREPTRDI